MRTLLVNLNEGLKLVVLVAFLVLSVAGLDAAVKAKNDPYPMPNDPIADLIAEANAETP